MSSQSPKVRRVYLAVTEKLILSHKGKVGHSGEMTQSIDPNRCLDARTR